MNTELEYGSSLYLSIATISKVLHRSTKTGNGFCVFTRMIQKDNEKFQKVKSKVMFQSSCQIFKINE